VIGAVSYRVAALVAGLWAGALLCIALIGTPAPFATLAPQDAGRVVSHIFLREAYLSLALAVLLFWFERRRSRQAAAAGAGSVLSVEINLLLGTLFCTVAGYFALQPMMAAARAGQGNLSFGALHAISLGFYGLKTILVVALAWRLAGVSRPPSS
jgi:Domain of unknown function (DUF4149)